MIVDISIASQDIPGKSSRSKRAAAACISSHEFKTSRASRIGGEEKGDGVGG